VLLELGAVTSLILSGLMCSLLILSTLMCSLLWGELARIRRSQQDAELKGHRLLEEWLSPQQRAQYQSSGSFEVTGSDSGTRYRIWRARQMNIEELDSDGKPRRSPTRRTSARWQPAVRSPVQAGTSSSRRS
jgi:hypothetical protein